MAIILIILTLNWKFVTTNTESDIVKTNYISTKYLLKTEWKINNRVGEKIYYQIFKDTLLVEEGIFGENDKMIPSSLLKYNQQKRLLLEHRDGTSYKYEYNKKGNNIRSFATDKNYFHIIEFDKKNRISREKIVKIYENRNDIDTLLRIYKYVFNDSLNTSTVYEYKKKKLIKKCINHYNKDNNLVKKENVFQNCCEQKQTPDWDVCLYMLDTKGKVIEERMYWRKENWDYDAAQIIKYDYNKNNRLVSKFVYKSVLTGQNISDYSKWQPQEISEQYEYTYSEIGKISTKFIDE